MSSTPDSWAVNIFLGHRRVASSMIGTKLFRWNKLLKKNIAAKINFFSVDSDLNLKNEKMFLLEQIVPLDKNEKIFY